MKASITKLRHARSEKDFPDLKLLVDEYVELVIQRSQLGVIAIWAAVIFGFCALTFCLVWLITGGGGEALSRVGDAVKYLYLIIAVLYILLFVVGLIWTKVYNGNVMVITNKRAIQEVTTGLFAHSTNIIELTKIEDVSFKQNGILQTIFRLGTIRMSTIGDETTYTFKMVDTPTDELNTITHLVYSAKNK